MPRVMDRASAKLVPVAFDLFVRPLERLCQWAEFNHRHADFQSVSDNRGWPARQGVPRELGRFHHFATVCSELFPGEQARIVQLLVERVDVREDALEVRVRAEELGSLVGELRQQGERMAA